MNNKTEKEKLKDEYIRKIINIDHTSPSLEKITVEQLAALLEVINKEVVISDGKIVEVRAK